MRPLQAFTLMFLGFTSLCHALPVKTGPTVSKAEYAIESTPRSLTAREEEENGPDDDLPIGLRV